VSAPRLELVRPPFALPEPSALDGLDDVALVAVAERAAALQAGALARLAQRSTSPSGTATPAQPAVLVDVKEAAKLIGVRESWLAAEARRGAFRSYKRGHPRRYDPREVVEDFKRLAGREP
jgi:hypothetical protein